MASTKTAALSSVALDAASPPVQRARALRLLGVPTLVEASAATMVFAEGEPAVVDGGRVKRSIGPEVAGKGAAVPASVDVAEQFLRAAIATDPGARPRRVDRPGGGLSTEMPVPPAGGLHRMPSEEGAPVGDDDVVEENEA